MSVCVHSMMRWLLVVATLGAVAPGVATTVWGQESGKPVVIHPDNQLDPRVADVFGGYTLVGWRGSQGTQIPVAYVSLLNAVGQPATGWPANGLRVGQEGFSIPAPLMIKVSDDAVALVWMNQSSGSPDGYVAWVSRTDGEIPAPADVFVDTVTARPGSQQVYCGVRQDNWHVLVALSESSTLPTRSLVKQLGPPSAPGTGWPAGGALLADTIAMFPKSMSDDGLGGCLLLTQSFHPCVRNDINDPPCPVDLKVHRLLSDGTPDPAWPVGGKLITSDTGWDQSGLVVSDRMGGAYAAWYNTTTDTLRIRVQHLGPDGQPVTGWGPNGVELAAGTSQIRYLLDLNATSTGNLVTTLELYSLPHLVALSPDGSIVPGWPSEVRLVPPGQFIDPVTAGYRTEVTPGDSVLVVWDLTDASSGQNIWGTAVGPDGTVLPGWSPGCQPLCTAPGGQYNPDLALCDDGTFKVAWVDQRNVLTTGRGIYFDHFAIADATVPVLGVAKLLSCRVDGRALLATWRVGGLRLDSVLALRSADDNGFVSRSGLAGTGQEELTLSDSLPVSFSRVRYFLALNSGAGHRAISDTLTIYPTRDEAGLRVRSASIQWGASLTFDVELDRDADGVEVAVFDVVGRRVREAQARGLRGGTHPMVFDMSGERPGLYYLRAKDLNGGSAVARVVLLP